MVNIVNGEIVSGDAPITQARDACAALKAAHRSIRMAHSLALLLSVLLPLIFWLWWGWRVATIPLLLCGVLARRGGIFVHNIMPTMLTESSYAPPTPEEVTAAPGGLWSATTLMMPLESLHGEWEVLLENLAFTCTYGKKNCLTNDMYTGEITLGKIFALVSNKLRQGIVAC